MSATTKSTHHATAALALPKPVSTLVTYARSVVTRMTGNPTFPAPAPALAAVTTAIDELEAAEKGALARTKGAVATRNEKKAVLVALLHLLLTMKPKVRSASVPRLPRSRWRGIHAHAGVGRRP